MKIKIASIIVLVVCLALTGCGTGVKKTTTSQIPTLSGYPATVAEVDQTAYPAGTMPEIASQNALSATQDLTLGAVQGILLLKGKPVVDVTIYLGNIVADDTGRELVAGYDRTSLMRASTDENGYFKVYNVPAGRYGLILDLVTQAYLMDTPDGTQSILLTVMNGKITDLGVLDYSVLPGL